MWGGDRERDGGHGGVGEVEWNGLGASVRCQNLFPRLWCYEGSRMDMAYLRDALLVVPPIERGPCDSTWVLALEEEGLGLAVLEAEDLAVAADVEFALSDIRIMSAVCAFSLFVRYGYFGDAVVAMGRNEVLAARWLPARVRGDGHVPCRGRSSHH